jgi:hypothetical protein
LKKLIFSAVVISLLLFNMSYAQEKSEKENIEAIVMQYLNSASGRLSVPSDLISTESLDKSKEMLIEMALKYDSTGSSNSMMFLPANKMKSMTSAEVWEQMNKISESMEKLDMKVTWNIANTEIKNDRASVTYNVKDRDPKVMQLKKEDNKWKIVLSFGSIF